MLFPILSVSLQTTSSTALPSLMERLLPPTARTFGLDAGKSRPGDRPSISGDEAPSPPAQQTVTPRPRAVPNAASIVLAAWGVQFVSGAPQPISTTDGLRCSSLMAALIASRKP